MYKPGDVQNKSGAGKDAPIYRCPACAAIGRLVTRKNTMRRVVSGCRCVDPPPPVEVK